MAAISLCEDAKLDPKIVERMDFSVSKMNIEFMEGDWKSGNATTQLNERIVDNPVGISVDQQNGLLLLLVTVR